jgi:hypothetical protein
MHTDIIVLRARVDWRAVLDDLKGAGVSGYRLADIMGLDWPTIRHWRDGGEPSHSRGMALLEVHERFCGKEQTDLRMDEAPLVL